MIEKDILDYIRGMRNAVKGEFILGRERIRDNQEIIFITIPGIEEPFYAFFHTEKSKVLSSTYSIRETEDEAVAIIEKRDLKGTGGKPAYVSLILREFEKVSKRMSIEAGGLLMKLIPFIEWNTGRLINPRNKKPLTRKQISNRFDIGEVKLKNLLSELSNLSIIVFDSRKQAYFVNLKILRKGMIE